MMAFHSLSDLNSLRANFWLFGRFLRWLGLDNLVVLLACKDVEALASLLRESL
jgi:hypothetical protein